MSAISITFPGRWPWCAALLLIVVACKGSETTAAPTTGSVQVTAATTGADLDPDGYTVALQGGDTVERFVGVAADRRQRDGDVLAAEARELLAGAQRRRGELPRCWSESAHSVRHRRGNGADHVLGHVLPARRLERRVELHRGDRESPRLQ